MPDGPQEDVSETSIRLMDTVGWLGYCEVELIEDPADGIVKVMEINGRLSASMKICSLVGMDPALQMLQLATGEEVTGYADYPTIRMRCIHTDLLWFIKSPRPIFAKAVLVRMKNMHDQIFSPDDPFAGICLHAEICPGISQGDEKGAGHEVKPTRDMRGSREKNDPA